MLNQSKKTFLEDVSFDDVILAEKNYVPKDDSGNEIVNAGSMFKIISNFGKLSDRKKAASFSIVDWNGNIRYDIRGWSEDYRIPYKGISYTFEEAMTIYRALSGYELKEYDFPLHTTIIGNTEVKFYQLLCELSTRTINGVVWNKQVSIVDWGSGLKYDFRKWTENYDRCSKGVLLTQSEVLALLNHLKKLR